MDALILAATHSRVRQFNRLGGSLVAQPLFALEHGKPNLTLLVEKVAALPDLERVIVVTNAEIASEIDSWAKALPETLPRVVVINDGTRKPDDRLGAVGDMVLALKEARIAGALLVIGGDNWLFYDLVEFVERSKGKPATVAVTPVRVGTVTTRFGVVEMDGHGVVRSFVEKPKVPRGGFKASCVYYFSGASRSRIIRFHEVRKGEPSSPGQLIEWLVDSYPGSVHAIEVAGSWHDVEVSGPDALRILMLLERLAPSGWEAEAARRLSWALDHDRLLNATESDDPNIRIVASRVLGRISDRLDSDRIALVRDRLLALLDDDAQNQFTYAGSQADEDASTFVCATAAESLAMLHYADTPKGVFAKARSQGYAVKERENIA